MHIYIGKRLKGPASTFCFPLVLFTRTCTISSQRRPEINSGYFVQTDSAFHFWRPPIAPAEMGHEGHYGALVFLFRHGFLCQLCDLETFCPFSLHCSHPTIEPSIRELIAQFVALVGLLWYINIIDPIKNMLENPSMPASLKHGIEVSFCKLKSLHLIESQASFKVARSCFLAN